MFALHGIVSVCELYTKNPTFFSTTIHPTSNPKHIYPKSTKTCEKFEMTSASHNKYHNQSLEAIVIDLEARPSQTESYLHPNSH